MQKLKKFFPMIYERDELLARIRHQQNLSMLFESWTLPQQEEFLNFCTGVRGVKLLYDSFFKEILNPENAPERMNDFLSLLLGRKVKVLYALPNDSTRIAGESSLLVMDIVVQLEDGSLANIEIQKVGYKFPGQRSACYSADLLLRQYKRVRGEKQKKFNYNDIKPVYTIVFFESSPGQFHEYPNDYLHYFQQSSNTGMEIDLLQKYLFIPLDIFKQNRQNKGIKNKLDAWLTFLSTDEPEAIMDLIQAYPEFKPLYDEIYQMCRNIERVMEMFSKELSILDRNTVQYMIDEMQDTIDKHKMELKELEMELQTQEAELHKQKMKSHMQEAELQKQETELQKQQTKLQKQEAELQKQEAELQKQEAELQKQEAELRKQKEIAEAALKKAAEAEAKERKYQEYIAQLEKSNNAKK